MHTLDTTTAPLGAVLDRIQHGLETFGTLEAARAYHRLCIIYEVDA